MKYFLINKKFFVLLLICLAGFWVLPKICLAEDFNNIDLKEIGKYLALPEDKVENLVHSLINIFYSEWTDLMASGYSTAEERAVPSIMKKVVQAQVLNHLLVDAPIEIMWKIIKESVDIAQIILSKDIKKAIEKLEKESVQKAVAYGMSVLFENEIRMSPGAMEFKYNSQKGEKKVALFQYIIIYQPSDSKRGEILIRFYSPISLEPPENRGSAGLVVGIYTELTHDLPPFIVDIRGAVEDYQWVGNPSMKIDFPAEVPDLGIKPLSWWEKYLLKPIESQIKEVDILITKVTGKSLGLTDIWEKVKSFISKITTFFPAALVQAPEVKEAPSATKEASKEESQPVMPESQPEPGPEPETKPQSQQLTLSGLQEMLDDIAEKIDILNRQVSELVEAKKQQTEKEIEEDEEEEILDKDLDKKEKKDTFCFIKSININTAPKEELQKIIGVGSIIAQRIIEARPFSSVYDLKRVSGIGEITLQGIIGQSCAYVVGGTGSGSASASVTYPKILISEVQIWDNTSNDHDFIELYNPGSNSENISGFQLKKRSSTGSESSMSVFPTGSIILAKGYFLWVNSNYASSTGLQANVTTTQTLAQNNSLVLLDPDKNIIDSLAWGSSTNPFLEGSPFPQSPEKGKSLGRKWSTTTQSYIDTDDNSADFEIQNPTTKAKNQSLESGPEPEPEPTPPFSVVVNEIAWMGTATSSNDEWIELHNTTKKEIDLTGWTLKAVDGTPSITFSTSIGTTTVSPLGFYLLERTDDDVVSDIPADQIYTGALTNTGEELELRDAQNNLIDKFGCQKDDAEKCKNWFAGDNNTKQTMERINPRLSGEDSTNWANNNPEIKRNGLDANNKPINGTPKVQNSVYQSLPPEAVADLTIDSQNSFANKVKLTWSTSTDPDTLPENLSYWIYYSKEGTISEDNLTASSTFSATTSATTFTISDLDYNSTYYFGVKTFDGQNYSSLSNIVFYQIPSALVNSAWPRFKKDFQRSGQSDFLGPQAAPTVLWVYEEEINPDNPDLNPLYTSPIIRSEGTILSSVIYPTLKQGILALNPDGSKKWFQEENIDFPLALQPDGSVLADDISRAWSEDETVYYFGQNDTLYAFDKDGNEKWKKQFEFMDPEQYLCSSSNPSVLTPAIGKDGIIYVVVQNNACSSQWDKVDYLYAISPENGNDIWPPVNLGGYNSSLPTVSDDNTVYVFNLTYPVDHPMLWLKAIFNGEIRWAKFFDNNFKSLPIVDSQGNIYFSIGKKVYGFDKEGGEIWQIYLVGAPSNWEIVSDFFNGLAVSTDGVLYLSGRGAIFALK